MAADIESLIRQALARQNGFDPQIRQKIYQSSRNALARMIAKSSALSPEIIGARNRALENTIAKIEGEFSAQVEPAPVEIVEIETPPEPEPVPQPRAPQPTPQPIAPIPVAPAPQATIEERISVPEALAPAATEIPVQIPVAPVAIEPQIAVEPVAPVAPVSAEIHMPPEPQPLPEFVPESITQVPDYPALDPAAQHAAETLRSTRPKPKKFRFLVWLLTLVIMGIVGWVAYSLALEYLTPKQTTPDNPQVTRENGVTPAGNFFTILDPTQPSALITGGNGTADIMSETSQPAIRVMSVRQPGSESTPAQPLLLKLAPGILKDIAGKKATVEIFAKSGSNSAATFSVTCQFGSLGECGRKRFRIGLQPEAVVFTIQISADYVEGQKAYLAINTDVTSSAVQSGKGAKIDIIYARIRVAF